MVTIFYMYFPFFRTFHEAYGLCDSHVVSGETLFNI
jgi:hypothetical protein